jgi:phage terminase large subunit-like protein
MHPMKDRRARLRVAARYIKNGTVKFPLHGCEQLLTQLLGFGVEKHDDAVDALVYLIPGLVGGGISPQEVHYV